MPSRKQRDALGRLDADLRADDITPEEYSREEARIHAGTSKYLKGHSFFERVAKGDANAIGWLIALAVVGITVLIIASVAFAPGENDDDGGGVQQQQSQPQEFDDDDDDEGFEEDDD